MLRYLKLLRADVDARGMAKGGSYQRGANLLETGVVLALIAGVVITSSALLTTQLTSTVTTAARGFDLASAGSGDQESDVGSNDYASVGEDVPAGEDAVPPVSEVSTPPPTIAQVATPPPTIAQVSTPPPTTAPKGREKTKTR